MQLTDTNKVFDRAAEQLSARFPRGEMRVHACSCLLLCTEVLEVMRLRMGEMMLVLWLSRPEGVGVFAGGGVGTEIGLQAVIRMRKVLLVLLLVLKVQVVALTMLGALFRLLLLSTDRVSHAQLP